MPTTDPRQPHQKIAAELRAQIMSGDLTPGIQLPTTNQLMTQYATTNQTVQRALRVLKDEGFLIGQTGVGVFVRPQLPLMLQPAAYMAPTGHDQPYRWLAAATQRNQHGTIDLLEVTQVVPPVQVAEALGLPADETAVLRKQILALDGEPTELAWNYYPTAIATGTKLVERHRIRGGSPTLLTELGLPPRDWHDRVSTRLPTSEELQRLDLPDGVPVIRTLRVVHTDDERPIEASILIKGGHLYEIAYQQQIQ